jgi:hypothetical protein
MVQLTYFCTMANNDLPTYAIIELLIRLGEIEPLIGNYQEHIPHEYGIVVKTTSGHINFNRGLVMQQLADPTLIDQQELTVIASLFKRNN